MGILKGQLRRVFITLLAVVTVAGLVLPIVCTPDKTETMPMPAPAAETPPVAESALKRVAPPAPGATSLETGGIIEIRVTDPPPADVRSAVVHLTDIELHRVSGNTSEWLTVIGAPHSFDLLDVIGVEAVLGSANITAGSFTQIRLGVDRVEVVTAAGDNITAEVPSEKLKIVGSFNVVPGEKTVLTLDFDGEKSLIITGKDKALFKPVVKLLIRKEKPGD